MSLTWSVTSPYFLAWFLCGVEKLMVKVGLNRMTWPSVLTAGLQSFAVSNL